MAEWKNIPWDEEEEAGWEMNKAANEEMYGERERDDPMERVLRFLMEDDETFFHRITEDLTDEEIEEYLEECPEDRIYWKPEKN